MKKLFFLCILFSFTLITCKKDDSKTNTITYDNLNTKNVSKIALGSCFLQQFFTAEIYDEIDKKNPEVFLGLGDMIYSDEFFGGGTHDTDWAQYLTGRYNELGTMPPFQSFRSKYPIHAIWDDHDYGMNNAAGEFMNKNISKDVFFNFWNLPKSGKRWERNGIYDVFYYGDDAHRVQLLFLDLRWNLDNPGPEPIAVITDQTKKMMSDEQWNWVKEELKKPAKIRIICSSTQFCTEHNGYETWANFPHEQERMYQTIKDAKAEHLFFLSGDVHIAEVNKRTPVGLYPIWDFTSSGMAQLHGTNTQPSQYRVGQAFDKNNFGTLDIDWSGSSPSVKFTAFDDKGVELMQQSVSMADLKLP
ncbi:MAG: alkaline phosphatase family protein [Chitinophagales bacterium]|nr:alkaline phosphatase family protein [Chitinophagales bacterium]